MLAFFYIFMLANAVCECRLMYCWYRLDSLFLKDISQCCILIFAIKYLSIHLKLNG